MHYLKQILHQAKQTFISEIIVDHHLVDSIHKICTKYGNNILLVADENTAEFLSKNIFNKISHFIIPSNIISSLARPYVVLNASKI
nr:MULTISPECIES: hypothetical protein [unclassified Wolbachia]